MVYLFTLPGQLNECSHRLEKLQQELVRYQGYLDDAIKGIQSGQTNSLTNSPKLLNGSRHHRNSGGSAAEEESLSRSASDSSVTNPTLNHNKQSAPGTPQLNHGWGIIFLTFINISQKIESKNWVGKYRYSNHKKPTLLNAVIMVHTKFNLPHP